MQTCPYCSAFVTGLPLGDEDGIAFFVCPECGNGFDVSLPDSELTARERLGEPECICLRNPRTDCPVHGDFARKDLDFDGNKPHRSPYGGYGNIGWW